MGAFRAISALIIALVIGCGTESSTDELAALLGSWTLFDERLQKEKDPKTRDLILLKLAVENPSHSPKICERMQSNGAIEKCQQVAGRPHLKDAR